MHEAQYHFAGSMEFKCRYECTLHSKLAVYGIEAGDQLLVANVSFIKPRTRAKYFMLFTGSLTRKVVNRISVPKTIF